MNRLSLTLALSPVVAVVGCGSTNGNLATLSLTVRECQQGMKWACDMLPAVEDAAGVPHTAIVPVVPDVQATASPSEVAPPDDSTPPQQTGSAASDVPLKIMGGTLVIPVTINNAISLNFVLDSGAADVSVPADVVLTLIRAGTISSSDFLGRQTYTLADGSHVPSATFRLRSLRVGAHEVRNITASVARVEGSLLLGQSFLRRFSSWSIDNRRQVLILN